MSFTQLLNAIFTEHARSNEIPVELVRQAWEDPQSREAIIDAMLESLDKLGGFEKVSFWMAALPASLSCDSVSELYDDLRSRSVRNELEWRIAFQADFPQCKGSLPSIEEQSICSYEFEQDLLTATKENDIESASMLIDAMRRVGLDPRNVRVASLEDLGLSEDDLQEMTAEDLEPLIQQVTREGGTPLRDYAMDLGRHEIIALLDAL